MIREFIEPGRWAPAMLGTLLVVLVTAALLHPGRGAPDGPRLREPDAAPVPRVEVVKLTHGIWLGHGWLGDDGWFVRNGRDVANFRTDAALDALVTRLRGHGVRYVYPHLCPSSPEGRIAPADDAQVRRFLDRLQGFDVIPWVGGVLNQHCFPARPAWRREFVASVRDLLDRHPRLAGVQVNIEPLPSGDAGYLTLLDDLRAALPPGKVLAVAAYPPPTEWHPYPDVHWDEAYFRQVARRCDQLAPMLYDTALQSPAVYQELMAKWTGEVLAWAEGKPVLLGVPAYEDRGVGYHFPEVENLEQAARGIRRALAGAARPGNLIGLAVYCEWEMTESKWRTFAVEASRVERGE